MTLKLNLLKFITTYSISYSSWLRGQYDNKKMLPETNAGHLMWHKRDAILLYVICRNKAIWGEFKSIDWSLCTVEVMKTQSLIWGEGHVHQADLSMCFVSCIVFAEVLTPLLCQCWLVILSQCFRGGGVQKTIFKWEHPLQWPIICAGLVVQGTI